MPTRKTDPKSDRLGGDYREGPNPAPGGRLDLDQDRVPPYEGRNTGRGSDESGTGESVTRQLEDTTGAGAHRGTTSPAQESPAREDELATSAAQSPMGVGESASRRGEHVTEQEGKERGRKDTGPQGATGRPSGTSDESDITGV